MRVVFIVTRDPRQRYRFLHDPLAASGVDVDRFEDRGFLLSTLLRGLRLARRRPQADIVMLTGGDIRNFFWFLAVRLFSRARVVARFGGDPIEVRASAQKTFLARRRYLSWLRSRVGEALTRRLLRRCDGVILVSDYLLDNLRHAIGGRAETLVLAPTIADPGASEPVGIEPGGDGPVRLLTVTNLNYREKAEGVIAILEALFDLARSSGYRLRYDVVGGGHQIETLRQWLESAEIPGSVEVRLQGKSEQVGNFYRNAELFVYHSTLDGYPLVLCEAQAFALPVVANRWGAFPDMLNHETDALLFESGNMTELRDALQRLLDDESLRVDFGRAARENFIRQNSPAACGEKLRDYLESLR